MSTAKQQQIFPDTRRLHPKWGYDLDKVPGVNCQICGRPIGDEEYVEDTGLARFGQMFFMHKRCVPAKKMKPGGDHQ